MHGPISPHPVRFRLGVELDAELHLVPYDNVE